MKTKLVPILANCVVLLLVVIGISGRIIEARQINPSPDNSVAAVVKVAGIQGREMINGVIAGQNIHIINDAIVEPINLIDIRDFDRANIVVRNRIISNIDIPNIITPTDIAIAHGING
jgi:hypothetical protein